MMRAAKMHREWQTLPTSLILRISWGVRNNTCLKVQRTDKANLVRQQEANLLRERQRLADLPCSTIIKCISEKIAHSTLRAEDEAFDMKGVPKESIKKCKLKMHCM